MNKEEMKEMQGKHREEMRNKEIPLQEAFNSSQRKVRNIGASLQNHMRNETPPNFTKKERKRKKNKRKRIKRKTKRRKN